jgi:hypothetical protein
VVKFTSRLIYLQGKNYRCLLNRSSGRTQRRSGRFKEKNNVLPLPGIDNWIAQTLVYSFQITATPGFNTYMTFIHIILTNSCVICRSDISRLKRHIFFLKLKLAIPPITPPPLKCLLSNRPLYQPHSPDPSSSRKIKCTNGGLNHIREISEFKLLNDRS